MHAMVHRPFIAFLSSFKFDKKKSTMHGYASGPIFFLSLNKTLSTSPILMANSNDFQISLEHRMLLSMPISISLVLI
jgi:hypothetical protein